MVDIVNLPWIYTSNFPFSASTKFPLGKGRTSCRVLGPNENVWKAQKKWKTAGRFVLENRKQTVNTTLEKVRSLLQEMENAQLKAGNNQLAAQFPL